MSKKELDVDSMGLGDLDKLFHNQGVGDYSWLSVDEEDYKINSAVPRQNLDMIPELQRALLADPDDGVPKLIPLRPHTVVNRNPVDQPQPTQRDNSNPLRNRVARLVTAGFLPSQIKERLLLEFPRSELEKHASVIGSIMNERGLLGNVYIDASHFPRTAFDSKEKKYVQAVSKSAKFVIGGCGGTNGCNCHETGLCSTFGGKKVVSEVLYDAKLAASYAPQLSQQGRSLNVSTDSKMGWKERLRVSFLQPVRKFHSDPVRTVQQQVKAVVPKVSAQDVSNFLEKQQEVKETPLNPSYIKFARRMMQGHDDVSMLLSAAESELRSLASEHGILGHTYVDVDALGGCRNTIKFLQSKLAAAGPEATESSVVPEFFLRRSSNCSICKNANDGACAKLCKLGSLIHSKPKLTKVTFASAMNRAVLQGRLTNSQCSSALRKASNTANWTKLTSEANLFHPGLTEHLEYTGSIATAYYGTRPGDELGTVQVDPNKVQKVISHLMNTGLSGKPLQAAILKSFSKFDLSQVPQVGQRMAAEEGVQGVNFIDPTAYSDYGRGCEEGSKHFRKRGAPNVMASDSCTGCTLQTAPGWCAKYSKTLIRQVPESVRKQISANRRLPVISSSVSEIDPSQSYELSSEMTIDLSGSKSRSLDVSITGPSFDD